MLGNPSTKLFDVYLANYNGWTWAYPQWDALTTTSFINVGGFDSGYSASSAHTTFKPSTSGSYLLPLDMLMFGKTYSDNSASYVSIKNDNPDFGLYQNTATLALNFRGLGLPTNQFEIFSNLLSTVTQGESTCLDFKGGYCALANTCDYYTDKGLWDYDFKLKFVTESDNNYIRVPLATFAANHVENDGLCAIFVEYLEASKPDSQQIIIGSMFFQSIYAQYTLTGVSGVSIDLFVNNNAERSATYIGAQVTTVGVDAFQIKPMDLVTDENSEMNGLPTFAASIVGVADANAYYLVDFTASHTVVWNKNCQQTGIGNYLPGSCELNPTLLSSNFDSADNSTGLLRETGTFVDAKFGGYVVSGTKYTTEMCFASGFCKLIQIYSGETVTADNWRFN